MKTLKQVDASEVVKVLYYTIKVTTMCLYWYVLSFNIIATNTKSLELFYPGALIDKIKFGAVEVDCLSGQEIDAFDYRYEIVFYIILVLFFA